VTVAMEECLPAALDRLYAAVAALIDPRQGNDRPMKDRRLWSADVGLTEWISANAPHGVG
jgi:hypothetical protein